MEKKWVVVGSVAIIVIGVAIALSINSAFSGPGGSSLSGEAQGFGGPVTVQVTLSDNRITGLEITGPQETPGIGAAAIPQLRESILEAGGIEGVDVVSGASVTSNAVFNAIRQAIGG